MRRSNRIRGRHEARALRCHDPSGLVTLTDVSFLVERDESDIDNLQYPPRVVLIIRNAAVALPPLHHDRRLQSRV